MENTNDESVNHDKLSLPPGTDNENISSIPRKGEAFVSSTAVHNTPNYQKTENTKKPSVVQDVRGMFGDVCKEVISDGELDYDTDSVMDIDSIDYVARDVEKIDNLNFDQSYVSSDEDD